MRQSLRRLVCLSAVTVLLSCVLAWDAGEESTLPVVVDAPMVFEAPLPPCAAVPGDWFDDAVFLGEARSEELIGSGLFLPGLALAQMGLNVRSVQEDAVFAFGNERRTLAQALGEGRYGKIYLMLGFNETVWMEEREFYREYAGLIDQVRQLLPQAQIYIQTLIPVTFSRSSLQMPDNAALYGRSELIRRLAREKEIYLLDPSAVLVQANGALDTDLSADGFRLNEKGNALWYQYLRTHTMGT